MRSFLKAALVAFAATFVVLVVGINASRNSRNELPLPSDTRSAFTIDVADLGEEFAPLSVEPSAAQCSQLAASKLLLEACQLTVLTEPVAIASRAHGALNFQDTPAYLAITWRARLDGDLTVCARSGLEADRLATCVEGVSAAEYEKRDAGLVVRVPKPTAGSS